MAVVLVGVTALTLTVEVIISRIAPADILPYPALFWPKLAQRPLWNKLKPNW
jgi:hypothetical protein